MPSKKNREPLAVKIAREILNKHLNRGVEWKPEVVFEDDITQAILNKLAPTKVTPVTYASIIMHGASLAIMPVRTSMFEAAGCGAPHFKPIDYTLSGLGRLRTDAMIVIRAAMMDLIKENNWRLMDEHIREVCPEL